MKILLFISFLALVGCEEESTQDKAQASPTAEVDGTPTAHQLLKLK